jgi:protein-disulfide isomerase
MVVATGCAVVVTWSLLSGRLTAGSAPPEVTPVFVDNWQEIARPGRRIGGDHAIVTIVEFGDYECPVCRRFANGALAGAFAEFGDDLALVFRHWPLSYHRFAYPAARAAECAAAQGRFDQMHDLLYRKGDSLGLKTFWSFADESGVADSSTFASCVEATAAIASIESGIAAAESLDATGTPYLLVNGRRLRGAPDSARFLAIVREALEEGRDR